MPTRKPLALSVGKSTLSAIASSRPATFDPSGAGASSEQSGARITTVAASSVPLHSVLTSIVCTGTKSERRSSFKCIFVVNIAAPSFPVRVASTVRLPRHPASSPVSSLLTSPSGAPSQLAVRSTGTSVIVAARCSDPSSRTAPGSEIFVSVRAGLPSSRTLHCAGVGSHSAKSASVSENGSFSSPSFRFTRAPVASMYGNRGAGPAVRCAVGAVSTLAACISRLCRFHSPCALRTRFRLGSTNRIEENSTCLRHNELGRSLTSTVLARITGSEPNAGSSLTTRFASVNPGTGSRCSDTRSR